MKKIIILAFSLLTALNVWPMEKDEHHEKTDKHESVDWNFLPLELKSHVLKFCINNILENRKFNKTTKDQITDLKIIERSCNWAIDNQPFLDSLRIHINNNRKTPVMSNALARLLLTSNYKENPIAISQYLKSTILGDFIANFGDKLDKHSVVKILQNELEIFKTKLRESNNVERYHLLNSCWLNNKEFIKDLIKSGVYFDKSITKKILKIALSVANKDLINLLVKSGIDLHQPLLQGNSALLFTLRILEQFDPEEGFDQEENYPKLLEIVDILIEAGCPLNTKEHNNTTTLSMAVALKQTEIVRKMLYHGASPDIKDNDNITPLMRSFEPNIILMLIESNANLNIQDNAGYTALMHHANIFNTHFFMEDNLVCFNHINAQAAHILINAGAALNIRNSEGYTALMLSLGIPQKQNLLRRHHSYHPFFIESIDALASENYDNLENIIKKLNDNNLQELKLGLYYSCVKDGIAVTEALIKAGADLDIKDNDGNTALMLAIMHRPGLIRLISLLINSGADLNIRNNANETTLIIALKAKNYKVAKLLLEAKVAICPVAQNLLVDWYNKAFKDGELETAKYLAQFLSTTKFVTSTCAIS